MIGGYASGTRVNLALERGEVQGRCGWSWASVKATRGHWIKGGQVNFLVQVALNKHKELPDLPLVTDFITNKRDRLAVELILARQEYGRPFMTTPGVPRARVAALRKAFMDTTRDAGFIKDINKQKLELNPYSGEAMQAQIARLYQTPQEVIDYAIEIQRKGGDKIKQIKTVYVKHTRKVVLIKRGGRRISIMYKGKKVKAKVSGRRTKITIDGKKAKRKAVKKGMTCTFTYPGAGEEAKTIDCKG